MEREPKTSHETSADERASASKLKPSAALLDGEQKGRAAEVLGKLGIPVAVEKSHSGLRGGVTTRTDVQRLGCIIGKWLDSDELTRDLAGAEHEASRAAFSQVRQDEALKFDTRLNFLFQDATAHYVKALAAHERTLEHVVGPRHASVRGLLIEDAIVNYILGESYVLPPQHNNYLVSVRKDSLEHVRRLVQEFPSFTLKSLEQFVQSDNGVGGALDLISATGVECSAADSAFREPESASSAPAEASTLSSPSPSGAVSSRHVRIESLPVEPRVGAWRYLPVPAPAQMPEPHGEFDHIRIATKDGFELLAARARGKTHRHDGSNCDDWFEVLSDEGPWTVIAVSDGLGSKKFSRLGAKALTKAALSYLKHRLPGERIRFDNPSLVRDSNGRFELSVLAEIQELLRESFEHALTSLAQECANRNEGADAAAYTSILGRPLGVEDCSATLLVAAHRKVEFLGAPVSLVVSMHAGDGAIGVLHENGSTHILSDPSKTDNSGEVDPATSGRWRAAPYRHSSVFVGRLQALLLATDGVADDYYPMDPNFCAVYSDLALNGVLTPAAMDHRPLAPATVLEQNPLDDATPADVDRICKSSNRLIPGVPTIRWASALDFARERKIAPRSLVRWSDQLPPLTPPNILNPSVVNKSSDERLLWWMDGYEVRGSFDDRTLVVMHRPG